MLAQRNGRKGRDAWGTWQGRVYNMTPYKDFHPGGVGELMRGAGKVGIAEKLFAEVHPWVNWEGMLGECLVGILVGEGEGTGEMSKEEGGEMDEMD
jgi:cytochrome b involved in lipid metabolism